MYMYTHTDSHTHKMRVQVENFFGVLLPDFESKNPQHGVGALLWNSVYFTCNVLYSVQRLCSHVRDTTHEMLKNHVKQADKNVQIL